MEKMLVNAIQASFQVCELCSENLAMQECQIGNLFSQPEQMNYMNDLQRGQESLQ